MKAEAAVKVLPISADTPKVSKHIMTGVVAQKYTHNASKYLRFFRKFSSVLRCAGKKKCFV